MTSVLLFVASICTEIRCFNLCLGQHKPLWLLMYLTGGPTTFYCFYCNLEESDKIIS